jgi:hypothetical protein
MENKYRKEYRKEKKNESEKDETFYLFFNINKISVL